MGVNNFEPYHIIPYSIMTYHDPIYSQGGWVIFPRCVCLTVLTHPQSIISSWHGHCYRDCSGKPTWHLRQMNTPPRGNHLCSPCHGWADLPTLDPAESLERLAGTLLQERQVDAPQQVALAKARQWPQLVVSWNAVRGWAFARSKMKLWWTMFKNIYIYIEIIKNWKNVFCLFRN